MRLVVLHYVSFFQFCKRSKLGGVECLGKAILQPPPPGNYIATSLRTNVFVHEDIKIVTTTTVLLPNKTGICSSYCTSIRVVTFYNRHCSSFTTGV